MPAFQEFFAVAVSHDKKDMKDANDLQEEKEVSEEGFFFQEAKVLVKKRRLEYNFCA
jgi:hypothetical protein